MPWNPERRPWASEVVPSLLWLGSGRAAEQLDQLSKRNMYAFSSPVPSPCSPLSPLLSNHVLNVADDVPNFHEGRITYLRLDVQDFGQDAGIGRVFEPAFAFLKEREEKGEPCLVHCAAGANRSATIVIAWLMSRSQCKLEEAWMTVKKARPGIVPLRDNRMQLMQLERDIHGVNFISVDQIMRL